MRIDQWRNYAQECLEKAGIERSEARLELFILIETCTGLNRSQQMIYPNRELEPNQLKVLKTLLGRRCKREPLAHLLGEWSFWGLEFIVSQDTLIPRADTEVLVEEVLNFLDSAAYQKIASKKHCLCDVGTGTGCIGLALASERPKLNYHLLDISPKALAIAKKNALSLRNNQKIDQNTQILFFESNLLQKYQNQLMMSPNIIVSNPPYVKRAVQETLMPEVKNFDPDLALFDEAEDGLDITRQLIVQASSLLPVNGALFIEVGYDQTILTKHILQEHGFNHVKIRHDYGGNPRVVSAIKYR